MEGNRGIGFSPRKERQRYEGCTCAGRGRRGETGFRGHRRHRPPRGHEALPRYCPRHEHLLLKAIPEASVEEATIATLQSRLPRTASNPWALLTVCISQIGIVSDKPSKCSSPVKTFESYTRAVAKTIASNRLGALRLCFAALSAFSFPPFDRPEKSLSGPRLCPPP